MSPVDPERLCAFYDAFTQLGITDRQFDLIYPDVIRLISGVHWTPVCVGRRAAELLVTDRDSKILDIGSGVGKFCIVGAMTTQGHFTGIEQRPWLNKIAEKTAHRLGVDRISLKCGDIQSIDWDEFNGFYLYNPFDEARVPEIAIDDKVGFDVHASLQNVYFCQKMFRAAPAKTRVVLYNGFGGPMPMGYVCKVRERIMGNNLELWIKEFSY